MKVSIIIPIYNKEKYLSRCIESVINQTYKKIEIICINDGSTDNSSDIVKEYQNKDKRIILIEQENKGVGIARNKGIEISTGKYILFVDADDALEINTVETYLKYSNFDFIISGFCEINENNKRVEYLPSRKSIKKEEFLNFLCNDMNVKFFSPICGKIFLNEIIKKNQLDFKSFNYGEDTHFIFQYMKKIKNIFILDKSLYINYLIPNSLSRSKAYNVKEVWLGMKEILKEGMKILPDNNQLRSFLFLRNIKTILLLAVISNYSLKDFLKIAIEIKKDFPKNITKNNISIYEKIILFLMKNELFILLYILLLIRKGILKIK